ncbi:MAG: HAD family hydrolase [Armatimonadota bacterium]
MIRAVLFDLDGTLLDSTRLLLDGYRYAVRTCLGVETRDEDWLPLMGRPLRSQMSVFSEEQADELVRVYRQYYAREHERRLTCYPGVFEMIQSLHAHGVRLAVVTSKKTTFAVRGPEVTGLGRYINVVVGEDDTAEHKPQPAPVLEALRRLEAEPSDSAMVGDSPDDIEAAKRAGVLAVAVLWGPFDRERLAEAEPDAWAERPEDIVHLVLMSVCGL